MRWGLILTGDAKFISTLINISFVVDPLVINVRSLLDALTIRIWCFCHPLMFFLGYGRDGC